MTGSRFRRGARALVVDEHERVLLVHFRFPHGDLWAAPGGGIEHGEAAEDAIRRELHEEVGLADPDVGPVIWTRRHVFPLPGYDGQEETFFLVRVREADLAAPLLSDADLRSENVIGRAWWSLDELRAATSTSFAPRRLPVLVARLLADGPPPDPIDTGV